MAILGRGEKVEGISRKAVILDWCYFRQSTDCPLYPAHLVMAPRKEGKGTGGGYLVVAISDLCYPLESALWVVETSSTKNYL